MTLDELRTIYDHEQRFDVDFPETRREATPRTVRYVLTVEPRRGWVLWSDLDESSADETIDAEIAYFEGLGCDFEWQVFSHDQPPDLKDRLLARGFTPREPDDSIMLLDLEAAPELLARPIPAEIERITTPEGVGALIDLLGEVWAEDFTPLGEELARQVVETPDAVSIYAAFVDGRAVSGAWTLYPGRSRFAGLWGGSTLPVYRNRGLYSGLLAVRAREAAARGRRFLNVDASPMSRPILEKHGFVCIATATACTWTAGENRVPAP